MEIETAIDKLNERSFFTILFNNRGKVYGGFIRDVIANIPPADIDIVISTYCADSFYEDMKAAGYKYQFNNDHGTDIWTKEGHLPVESYIVEDDPDDTIIGPITEPDYDVNTLIYNGNELDTWAGDNNTKIIIKHILKRIAVPMGDFDFDRELKIKQKGYQVSAVVYSG